MKPLTPRVDRLRALHAARERIDAEIQRLVDAEVDDEPSQFPDCGTERAYKRHRAIGEQADKECLAAHAAYVKSRSKKPCGSEQRYQQHRHTGDTATDKRRVTCEPCLEAHRLMERIRTARNKLEGAA